MMLAGWMKGFYYGGGRAKQQLYLLELQTGPNVF